MDSSDETAPMHLFTSFFKCYIWQTAQSKLRSLIIWRFIRRTMFEIPIYDDSNGKRMQQKCWTGDNKCVPISKVRGGGVQDFLIGGSNL